jgi:hypothetical protein
MGVGAVIVDRTAQFRTLTRRRPLFGRMMKGSRPIRPRTHCSRATERLALPCGVDSSSGVSDNTAQPRAQHVLAAPVALALGVRCRALADQDETQSERGTL